jgi:hypothetical protein
MRDLEALRRTLDAVLEQAPGQETWRELTGVLDQGWALAPEVVATAWVPALVGRLERWPPGLRDAPRSWVEEEARAPLLAAADTFEAAKKLKPAARRQLLDRLAERAPQAASSAIAYFVRAEDRTMMKQLADFGALATPALLAGLREEAATEKRVESLASLASQLGPAAREAAGLLADRIVALRARRPSQKTVPALQRLTEALLGCGAPEEDLRRALTPLLDYADGTLRTLARRTLEERGLPAPRSPWEACAVGWPVIAELQRLGCTFDPGAPRRTRMDTPAGEVEVPQPFLDLFAVKWPRGEFQGSEWMFGTDAHSDIRVDFRTPYFPDIEAYAKRPYVELASDGCGGYFYHVCLSDVPATLTDETLANIPVYRLERGGEWYHPRGSFLTTLQTFFANLSPMR